MRHSNFDAEESNLLNFLQKRTSDEANPDRGAWGNLGGDDDGTFEAPESRISRTYSADRLGSARRGPQGYLGTPAMLIYITGGARSGKSRYAQDLAKRMAKRVVFVATAFPSDEDLKKRIARHRRERPKSWTTIENPVDLASVVTRVTRRTELLVVDCLTLYVAGGLVNGEPESKISTRVEKFCKAAAASPIPVILVSNEIGCGLVPTTEWGLKFRDYLGRANQIAARYAEKVVLMVSGLPVSIKGALCD